MKNKQFYLLDQERTKGYGEKHYWKQSQWGYTTDIKEAGVFSEEQADKIIEGDKDNTTVKVPIEETK